MKAIALISGGLDSILAARLINEQGIGVIAVNFKIPFCHSDKKYSSKDRLSVAAHNIGLGLEVVDIGDDFLKMLESPRYGYGANMNPCIDCKILMLSKAKELMAHKEAAFIITGEVLGQRPMSQNRQALEIIEKRSGLEGLVLRPLSAKLLSQTIPEKEGWIKRDKLLGFSGRGRKPQIDLAGAFGIEDYAQPAGGCLLTEPQFSKRLRDLIAHQEVNIDNVKLLKVGRHFRLYPDAKLIVGRDKKENEELLNLAQKNDYLFFPPADLAGPVSLGRGVFNDGLIELSCSIACRYCDLNGKIKAGMLYRRVPDKEDKVLEVFSIEDHKAINLRIG